EQLRIVGKQRGHDGCGGTGGACMTGGITGVLRICKKCKYGWIGLAGPQFEICVLRIPTGQRGVMLRDRLVRICSCCAWRVGVQVVLEYLEIDLLEPQLEKARLPEPGQM